MGRLAGFPGSDRCRLTSIVIPHAPFERFLYALEYPFSGKHVGRVEPVVDLRLGVVAVCRGASYLAPVVCITVKEELVSSRHAGRQALHRVLEEAKRIANEVGVPEFHTIPISIRIEGF